MSLAACDYPLQPYTHYLRCECLDGNWPWRPGSHVLGVHAS